MAGTKRRRIGPRQHGLTPRALEAWRVGDWHTLNAELGIRPWMVSPFDAAARPTRDDGSPWAQSWPRAAELRRRLIEAAGPPGRVGRHGEPLGPRRGCMNP